MSPLPLMAKSYWIGMISEKRYPHKDTKGAWLAGFKHFEVLHETAQLMAKRRRKPCSAT